MTTEGPNTPVSTPSGPSAGLEGQGATQETAQDATEAAQGRVERYEDLAVRLLELNDFRAHDRAVAARIGSAYRSLADQEQAELRAERDLAMACWKSDMRSYHAAKSRAEAAEARVAELADDCADSSCIHLNTLWGALRAILDTPKDTTETPCPTCSGPSRETVGMVCQTCGTDYAPKDTTAP